MNLFDVHRGCKSLGAKPRNATQDEVRAYLQWIAARDGVTVPKNAEYHPAGIWSPTAREYIVAMPGHGQKQVVTCEILDEAGEVVRSMTLPQDKRGGIPATAKQVQEWTGLKAVKAKRAKVTPPTPVAAPAVEPVEEQEALAPTCDKPEAEIMPVAAPAVDLEAITARLDALEQALATLSAVSVDDREVTTRPVVVTEVASCDHLPKRTPAHERAIRRAWAERKARREAQSIADQAENYARNADAKAERVARAHAEQVADLEQRIADWEALQHRTWTESMGHKVKRRAATLRARRMIGAARSQEMIAQARASAARAEIDRLKRDMADPSQPERASDIARLVQERDTARTALAAMAARAERAEQGLHSMADRFEGLVSRVTRAEAALRQQNVA